MNKASDNEGAAVKPAAEILATPVQFLKGVGPARAELLTKLGLYTARDVLFFFPRDYQDLSDLREVPDLVEGKPLSVRGVVEEVDQRTTANGGIILGVLIKQGRHYLRAVWFNQPFMREKFSFGQCVLLFGQARYKGGRWEMAHPRVDFLESENDQPKGALQPVYPLTEGVKQYQIRNVIGQTLDAYTNVLDEVFPEALLRRYRLAGIHQALPQIHFPTSAEGLEQARRRFVFQELFILQLALALRRREQHDLSAPPLPVSAKIDARICRLLPFELTAGQRQVIEQITADMAREFPMNRLLQGDVGSGKTMVAVYAMMTCVAHGHQAAIMAPTEILARQHAQTLSRVLAASQVRLGLLTGGLTAALRRETLERIADGRIDIVIGTQAIIQSGVDFAKLGLVVIDEQHKFGVRQRAALKSAGLAPHYLVMTATPIPRSVSMTLFGDLDASTLHEKPPGRQEVHTYLVEPEKRGRWWDFVRNRLDEGRQAFVIAPLVEESELVELESAEQTFEQLANGELEAYRIDLVHGRMSATEKEAAMESFRTGTTQVLVATSVVEVGVDVPNATVMTILGAERFGLAQLHQLRGRVSRGTSSGFCGVLAEAPSIEAGPRLAAFAETTDGFRLAEIDFDLRGPGDLFGTKQHGLPPLRIADLRRDAALLEEARNAAQRLIAEDPGLAAPELALLRRMVLVRYGEALKLGDVG